jgi:hypothetical protein
MMMHKTLLTVLVSVWTSVAVVACGDDGGGTGDDTTDPPDAATLPTCAAYCTAIQANCTGGNQQYTDLDTCLDACAGFPVGALADTSGNTVGCRTYHAGAAEGGPETHCRHAGPGGAGLCGTNCEGFCAIAAVACTGANLQYASTTECMAECAGFADDEPYDTADTGGDTLACRLYHLTAATQNPGLHCGHIVEASDVCN